MSPSTDPQVSDFRMERKFLLEGADKAGLEALLLQLSAAVRPAYPDRWVNSLYFDDSALSTALDNLRGVGDRSKYRLRWYGDWQAEAAKLQFEIKERRNQGIRKQLFYQIDQQLPNWLNGRQQPPSALSGLMPVAGIRYLRSYYQTFDRQIRLTIDRQVQGGAWQKDRHLHWLPLDGLVLEVKYPTHQEERAIPLLQELPFRPDRHSKYLRALQLCFA